MTTKSAVGRSVMLALGACLVLASCSGFVSKLGFGGKVRFEVEVDEGLNQDFPLAVDFVVIYDKPLFGELKKLSAQDWFDAREQFRADNEPERLEIHSWEWVPGQRVQTRSVDHRIRASGGIVFANYFNPGTHRIVIQPLRNFTLKLRETEVEVVSSGGR